MEFRRLNPEEHGRTRTLYEEVFPEDDKAFVDYYYKWKTKDNTIYVAEDVDGIHAMVHLNPFRVSVLGKVQKMHYIVAVATQKEYRHQGLMRRLLAMAEQDMRTAGEGFTFLMPASEQIYLPFGYRFFCNQKRGILEGEEEKGQSSSVSSVAEESLQKGAVLEKEGKTLKLWAADLSQEPEKRRVYCRPATPSEYDKLAQFVNETLNAAYDVFVFRDETYYERLQAEQSCQDGEIIVICQSASVTDTVRDRAGREEQMIGTFCTATEHRLDGDVIELREIIFAPEYLEEAKEALLVFAGKYGNCRVAGCMEGLPLKQEQIVSLLMGKVPGGGVLSSGWNRERVFMNEVV